MADKSYYDILGVSKDASEKEIQKAFRRLARKHHPDVNPGDNQASEKFKEVNEAYQVLSNQEARQQYDQRGRGWNFEEFFGRGPQSFSWTFESQGGPQTRVGHGAFDDILSSVMRSRGRSPFGETFETRPAPSVEHPIEVTLEEAYRGTKRVIEYVDQHACAVCAGSGRRGQGMCPQCGGAGGVREPRRLEVKVPAGVDTGTKVKISPSGQEGRTSAIYLVVEVKPHGKFVRKGKDLHVEVPVPLVDVVLGGEVQVETMNGKVSLKIPQGTQSGRTFRLRGKGMPALNKAGKGDLLAKVKVVLPRDMSEEELDLFRRLKKIREGKGE